MHRIFFCLLIKFSYFPYQSVGNRVGVSEPYLMQMAHGAPISMHSKQQKKKGAVSTSTSTVLKEVTHRVSKRFYVALMLSRLVQASSTFCLLIKSALPICTRLYNTALGNVSFFPHICFLILLLSLLALQET